MVDETGALAASPDDGDLGSRSLASPGPEAAPPLAGRPGASLTTSPGRRALSPGRATGRVEVPGVESATLDDPTLHTPTRVLLRAFGRDRMPAIRRGLLAAALALALLWLTYAVGAVGASPRVLSAYRNASRSTSHARSGLACRRLLVLGEPGIRFVLAQRAVADGQVELGASQMALLAPLDGEGGDARAHWWLAARILAKRRKTGQERRELERRLEQATSAAVPIPEANYAYARLLRRKGDLDGAIAQMTLAAAELPEHRFGLVFLYRLKVMALSAPATKLRAEAVRRQADTLARQLILESRAALDRDPQDLVTRVRLAGLLELSQEFEAACRVLRDGLVVSDAPNLRRRLARVYVKWSRSVERGAEPDRVTLLIRALRADRTNVGAFRDLLALSRARRSAVGLRAREALVGMRFSGVRGAQVLVVSGWYAWHGGDRKRGLAQVEEASRMAGDAAPGILNDLALMLLECKPPALGRALELASRAVALRPARVEYRDTRGHVLARIGRHREALDVLLPIVRRLGSADRVGTHRVIADCYDSFQMHEEAQTHRRAANAIEDKLQRKP